MVVDADEVGDALGVSGVRRLFPQQRIVGVDVDEPVVVACGEDEVDVEHDALDVERSQGADGVGRGKDAELDIVIMCDDAPDAELTILTDVFDSRMVV